MSSNVTFLPITAQGEIANKVLQYLATPLQTSAACSETARHAFLRHNLMSCQIWANTAHVSESSCWFVGAESHFGKRTWFMYQIKWNQINAINCVRHTFAVREDDRSNGSEWNPIRTIQLSMQTRRTESESTEVNQTVIQTRVMIMRVGRRVAEWQ